MKAKEYAAKYQKLISNQKEEDAQFEVVKLLLNETVVITKQRKCKILSAYTAVIKEMQQKWLAICSLTKLPDYLYALTVYCWNETVYKITVEANVLQCYHPDVYYSEEHNNYYCKICKQGMGEEFYKKKKQEELADAAHRR